MKSAAPVKIFQCNCIRQLPQSIPVQRESRIESVGKPTVNADSTVNGKMLRERDEANAVPYFG